MSRSEWRERSALAIALGATVAFFASRVEAQCDAFPSGPGNPWTTCRDVTAGIVYFDYANERTPMHVVVVDRSHAEYALRVRADRELDVSGEPTGALLRHTVSHFAVVTGPPTESAIVAINGSFAVDSPGSAGIRDGERVFPINLVQIDGVEWAPVGVGSAGNPEYDMAFASNASMIDLVLLRPTDLGRPENARYASGDVIGAPDCVLYRGRECPSVGTRFSRSAIGYSRDHVVFISSHQNVHFIFQSSADVSDVAWFFRIFGVEDALLLDGGPSAQLDVATVGEPVNPVTHLVFPLGVRFVPDAIALVRVACGGDGQRCCASASCSGSLECVDGTCTCADADADARASDLCGGDDCDDTNASVHPGASEVCGNLRDDNCNTVADESCSTPCSCRDADGDTYYATSCGDALCTPRTDCDDGVASAHPGGTERANYADDDCDGATDEGFRTALHRLYFSNGAACGNPAADWDHCFAGLGSGSCIGSGQGGGAGYDDDAHVISIYDLSVGAGATSVMVGPHLMALFGACYAPASTIHVYEPTTSSEYARAGWACEAIGYVRTGSALPGTVEISRHQDDGVTDRMYSSDPYEGSSLPFCSWNHGIAWWAWP